MFPERILIAAIRDQSIFKEIFKVCNDETCELLCKLQRYPENVLTAHDTVFFYNELMECTKPRKASFILKVFKSIFPIGDALNSFHELACKGYVKNFAKTSDSEIGLKESDYEMLSFYLDNFKTLLVNCEVSNEGESVNFFKFALHKKDYKAIKLILNACKEEKGEKFLIDTVCDAVKTHDPKLVSILFNVLDENSPIIETVVNYIHNNMMYSLVNSNIDNFKSMVMLFKDSPNILGRIMTKFGPEGNIILVLLKMHQRDDIVDIFNVILDAVKSHENVLVELLNIHKGESRWTEDSVVEHILREPCEKAKLKDEKCHEQLFLILYEAVKNHPALLSNMVKQVEVRGRKTVLGRLRELSPILFLNENIVTKILDSKDEEAIEVFFRSKSVEEYLTQKPKIPLCQLLQTELQTRPNIFRYFVAKCPNDKWKKYQNHFNIKVNLNDVGWQRAKTIFNMMRSEEDKIYLKDQLLKLINDINITSLTDKQLTQTLSNLIYKGMSKELTFLYDHLVPKKYLKLKTRARLLVHGANRKTKIYLETGKDRQSQLQK